MYKIAFLFSLMLCTSSLFAQVECKVASGATGESVAAWTAKDSKGIRVAEYSAGAWSPEEMVPRSDDFVPNIIAIEMDRIGNCILVWETDSKKICSSIRLKGHCWTPSARLSGKGESCSDPVITLDPAGSATLVWRNKTHGMQSSRLFVGTTTWSTPETISN